MRWKRVQVDAFGFELGPVVVSSHELEDRLAPAYERLRIPAGQLEALTGIAERRWWEPGPGRLTQGAAAAARKALARVGYGAEDLGAVIYGGVCREQFEPATACAIAHEVGVRGDAVVLDISNACLGALEAMVDIANRIELGQMRAGLVVSAESSREIVELTISELNAAPTMEAFKYGLATMTGGSGAIAVLLSDGSLGGGPKPRLLGGARRAHPEHHELCQWGLRPTQGFDLRPKMRTDAVAVLEHGVKLGLETWRAFLQELGWTPGELAQVICHQVGSGHRDAILRALEVDPEREFGTFETLGNIGTVSLPLTAAIAADRGVLERGDKVGFLGIGSGLNCLMLGLEW